MSRSRIVGLSVVFLLSMTQAACVAQSENPLIAPEKAALDEHLLGQWKSVEGAQTSFYFFGRPIGVSNCPEGLLVLHTASVSAKREILWDADPQYGFATTVGKEHYFHLIEFRDCEMRRIKNWDGTDVKSYHLLKYALSEGRIVFWMMDPVAASKEVESGKIKGEVKRRNTKDNSTVGEVSSVMLKDSTKNLRLFLENGGNKTLFDDKLKLVLTRVKW